MHMNDFSPSISSIPSIPSIYVLQTHHPNKTLSSYTHASRSPVTQNPKTSCQTFYMHRANRKSTFGSTKCHVARQPCAMMPRAVSDACGMPAVAHETVGVQIGRWYYVICVLCMMNGNTVVSIAFGRMEE